MNERERFRAICLGEEPDYIPIFGFPGAPGMSMGCMAKTHDRLLATGMPNHVGGRYDLGNIGRGVESWAKFWGTSYPTSCHLSRGLGAKGFKWSRRIENGFEIIESESGAITRQVIDNDITYSMPEFIEYPVRDRASWELWKERMTPTQMLSLGDIHERVAPYKNSERPVFVGISGAYGFLRGILGPERLSFMFYDDPELIHDIMAWRLERTVEDMFPTIEALKPDIVQMGEDLCFNHGMLLSPALFHEFCGEYYRTVCDFARSNDVLMVAVDTDGNLMEFAEVATSYGVNGLFPCEVKAGNDLFELRRRHPELVLFGWLEKESINEGNESMIEPEIMNKVPALLREGRYFPNGDHGIQPLATYPNLCRFMTILHEVCNNPLGEFPRVFPPNTIRRE